MRQRNLVFAICLAAMASACSPEPPRDPYAGAEHLLNESPAETPINQVQADALEKQRQLEAEIDEARKKNTDVNWMHIGISTGKFSESLSAMVYQTHNECIAASFMEDNECVPVPALPDSYWNAKPVKAKE